MAVFLRVRRLTRINYTLPIKPDCLGGKPLLLKFRYRQLMLLLSFVMSMTLAGVVQGQSRVSPTIVGPEIEGWIEKDGGGFFLEALSVIADEAEYELQFEARPLARSLVEFERGEFECYGSGDRNAIEGYLGKSLEITSSLSFASENLRAFTLREDPRISSLADMRGKTIGIQLGGNLELFGLGEFRDKISEVAEIETLVELLKLGRLDIVVEYNSTFDQFSDVLHFDENLVLYSLENAINCFLSPSTISFIEAVNKGLIELKKRGAIDEIYRRNLN